MFVLPVMVVEGYSVQEATGVALRFNRRYFWQILSARFLVGLVPTLLEGIPLSGFLDSLADVFVSIVILDLYLNYRKLGKDERLKIDLT